MARQVVGDDDVTDRQAGCQELLDIGEEGIAIDRAIEHQRSDHAVEPKPRQEGAGVPVTMRHSGQQALAAGTAATQPCHVCCGPGFVEEDQLLGVQPGLKLVPDPTSFGDISTLLLGRSERLFFHVSPRRSSVFHISPALA